MNYPLKIYWFPGDPGTTAEFRDVFIPDGDDADEMVANVCGTVLRFGWFHGEPGVIVEVEGETAFIINQPFVEPFQPFAFAGED
jgi:hypothetical protein